MKLVRSVDTFERYISLRNNNQSKYRTCCGGIMTIFICILMVVFLVILITNPLETKKTTISNTTTSTNTTDSTNIVSFGNLEFENITDFRTYNKHTSRTDDDTKYDLKAGGWAFGLYFSQPYDPTILNITFQLVELNPSLTIPTVTYFNATTCNQDSFPLDQLSEFTFGNIISVFMICPDLSSTNLTIQGDFQSNEYKYFQFYIQECSGSGCADQEAIKSFVSILRINVLTSNTYYDHTDLASPIKSYISTSPNIIVNLNSFAILALYITPTEVKYLNGSSEYVFSTFSPELKENHFEDFTPAILLGDILLTPEMYTIEQQITYQPILNNTARMLSNRKLDTTNTTQTIEEDKNSNVLYTAFFIMAQLGGFYAFLKLLIGPVFNIIYEQMLLVDLLNRFNSASSKNTPKINCERYHQEPRVQMHEEEKKMLIRDQDLESSILKEGGSKNRSFARSNDQDQLISRNHIQRSRSNLISQNFELNEYTYMQGILHAFKCKKTTKIEEIHEANYMNNIEQFEKDLQRFNHEADIINLIMSNKETKLTINKVIGTVVQLSESIENLHPNNALRKPSIHINENDNVKVTQNQVPRLKNMILKEETTTDGGKISKTDTFAKKLNSKIEKIKTEVQNDEELIKKINFTKIKTVKVDADGNK